MNENAMKCREFQIEIEESPVLSETVQHHLGDCPECRKFYDEQVRLPAMLGSLPRVAVPEDFNFQLKARIARARPADHQPNFSFPALRYVLPLSVVLILLSIVALSGLYYIERQQNAGLPESVKEQPAPVEVSPNSAGPPPVEIADAGTPQPEPAGQLLIPVKTEPSKKRTSEIARKDVDKGVSKVSAPSLPKVIPAPENDDGGSKVLSANQPQRINPPGIGANRPITAPDIATTTEITEVLQLLGIETVSENNALKVRTVTKNSVAERSGVRIGDQIEAIDGNKITGEPLTGKTINGKTLTVRRNGQKKEITLQNQ